MGFIKSMAQLTKQGHEINKNWDVGAQLADAQASMAGAQQMMAQQTQAANLAHTGVDGVATITGVRQGAGMVNYQPILDIDLMVQIGAAPAPAAPVDPLSKAPAPAAPAGVPIPVTVSQVVEQIYLAKAQPGLRVAVKVDPSNPQSVFINWAAPVL